MFQFPQMEYSRGSTANSRTEQAVRPQAISSSQMSAVILGDKIILTLWRLERYGA